MKKKFINLNYIINLFLILNIKTFYKNLWNFWKCNLRAIKKMRITINKIILLL